MVQANGATLSIRAAAFREYEALEDEERRETGREFQVIHPHAPVGSGGGSWFPFRDWGTRCVGESRLQDKVFPRQR
jgi:hypothetical protein